MNTISAARPLSPSPAPSAPRANPQHGPDLVIDSVAPSNSFPMPGESVWFDITVHNQGDRDAGAFNVSLSSDNLNDSARVSSGLKAGAKGTLRHLGPLNTMNGESFYWVQANADSDNEVDETREDNNYLISSISVQQPPQPPPMPPIPPMPPHAEFLITKH